MWKSRGYKKYLQSYKVMSLAHNSFPTSSRSTMFMCACVGVRMCVYHMLWFVLFFVFCECWQSGPGPNTTFYINGPQEKKKRVRYLNQITQLDKQTRNNNTNKTITRTKATNTNGPRGFDLWYAWSWVKRRFIIGMNEPITRRYHHNSFLISDIQLIKRVRK